MSYNYGIPIYIHPIGLIPCLGEVGYNYGIPIHLKWGRQQPSDSPIYQLEKARLVFKIESSGKVKEIYVQVVNLTCFEVLTDSFVSDHHLEKKKRKKE